MDYVLGLKPPKPERYELNVRDFSEVVTNPSEHSTSQVQAFSEDVLKFQLAHLLKLFKKRYIYIF